MSNREPWLQKLLDELELARTNSNHTQTTTELHIMKCLSCGAPMKLRIARNGPSAGNSFYGCSRYPQCTYTSRPKLEKAYISKCCGCDNHVDSRKNIKHSECSWGYICDVCGKCGCSYEDPLDPFYG